ncbi:MAG TPA: deoxyribose-phosphate aldolase [Anaeromyxobacter sp.]
MATVPPESVKRPQDLAPLLDHTLLAPGATAADLARLCAEAREHALGAVCVHRQAVAEARRLLAGAPVKVVAVADFPKGAGTTGARIVEALEAVRAGADEIDLVAPLPALLSSRFEAVLDDLRSVVRALSVPVKVILETSALDRDRKVAGAALALAAGAAYVKTSTGFAGGGATVDDVALLRAVVGEAMGVKASGGIRTAAQALAMVRAGADRIGSSSSIAIVTGKW